MVDCFPRSLRRCLARFCLIRRPWLLSSRRVESAPLNRSLRLWSITRHKEDYPLQCEGEDVTAFRAEFTRLVALKRRMTREWGDAAARRS